jgi:hypothetical protein
LILCFLCISVVSEQITTCFCLYLNLSIALRPRGERLAVNLYFSSLFLWGRSATGAVQLAQCNWRSATEGLGLGRPSLRRLFLHNYLEIPFLRRNGISKGISYNNLMRLSKNFVKNCYNLNIYLTHSLLSKYIGENQRCNYGRI